MSRSSSTDRTSLPSCSRWLLRLRLLVLVELALDQLGAAVEDVDHAPEHVLQVVLEAGAGEGLLEGGHRLGQGPVEGGLVRQRPGVVVLLERAVAGERQFLQEARIGGQIVVEVVGLVVEHRSSSLGAGDRVHRGLHGDLRPGSGAWRTRARGPHRTSCDAARGPERQRRTARRPSILLRDAKPPSGGGGKSSAEGRCAQGPPTRHPVALSRRPWRRALSRPVRACGPPHQPLRRQQPPRPRRTGDAPRRRSGRAAGPGAGQDRAGPRWHRSRLKSSSRGTSSPTRMPWASARRRRVHAPRSPASSASRAM